MIQYLTRLLRKWGWLKPERPPEIELIDGLPIGWKWTNDDSGMVFKWNADGQLERVPYCDHQDAKAMSERATKREQQLGVRPDGSLKIFREDAREFIDEVKRKRQKQPRKESIAEVFKP